MNQNFLDLLHELVTEGVAFLVVGAHAMAVHGVPRATGDLDVWVRADAENATKVWAALARFGAPLAALDFDPTDLEVPGMVWQIGVPPQRIDILTSIDGVTFEDAYATRSEHELAGIRIPFLGLESLRVNKAATGRAKDRVDLELLDQRGASSAAD